MRPPRTWALGLLIAVAPMAVHSALAETPQPSVDHLDPAPGLRQADEQFLLQMRESLGSQAPVWSGTPPEQQEAWFRQGLQQAAHEPRRPGPPNHSDFWPARDPRPEFTAPPLARRETRAPEPWRRLFDSSRELRRIADDLDLHGFWAESDEVRTAAAKLRQRARELAEGGDPRPE